MPGVLPGPAGDIGEAGAARRDRLVRIAAGRARWSEAAWLWRDDGDVRVPGGSSGWVGVNGFVNGTLRDGPGRGRRAGTGEDGRPA